MQSLMYYKVSLLLKVTENQNPPIPIMIIEYPVTKRLFNDIDKGRKGKQNDHTKVICINSKSNMKVISYMTSHYFSWT